MKPRARAGTTRRRVQLRLDGTQVVASMTASEERQLRARLAPYVAVARPVAVGMGTDAAEALREARLRALFRMPTNGPTPEDLRPEVRQLVDRAADLYSRSLEDSTAEAYRRRWIHFANWCQRSRHSALPASVETVMLYMADLVAGDPQPALATVRGRVSAINRMHAESDLPVPGDDPVMRLMMRGLSRSVPQPPVAQQTAALRIDDLRDILSHLAQPDPVLIRDSALLRLHAQGITTGRLSRLTWQDVTVLGEGIRLDLRPPYHRTPDESVRLKRTKDPSECPVGALLRWRDIAGTDPAQVFSAVDRNGRRHGRQLSTYDLNRVILTRTESLTHGREGIDAVAVAARLLDQAPNDVLRDRALLLLGWAGAFRRVEVTRLLWRDIRQTDQGLVVRLRQSKTDTYHRGVNVGIPAGRSLLTCPVRATLAWRDRMAEQLGETFDGETPCWPGIGRAGRLNFTRPITPEGLTVMIRRRAAAAGLDAHFGGRSLRAGFITTASELELPMELIANQSRHANFDNLLRYVRQENLFLRNAANRVGL